jgi:predicted amidohydrolase
LHLARILAAQGVDLIVVPTANTTPFTNHVTVPSRAYENHIFVAYVNRSGNDNGIVYNGESNIVAPNGTKLAQVDGPGDHLLVADIIPDDPEYIQFRQHDPQLQNRRPSLYGQLTQK